MNESNQPDTPQSTGPLAVTQAVPFEHRPTSARSPIKMPDRVGQYILLRKLGEGGMGIVYLASDTVLQREVALKILRAELANNPESRERFLREARAAASLKHQHVVTIYHVGEDDQTPFMAMELLRGETLEDRLNRPNTLPIADAVRIGRQVAEALATAHENHIIHRDVKPSNIWLQTCEVGFEVVLLDFGLALDVTHDVRLTQTGYVMGTPAYMSPEQTRAWPLDHRSDLFSLGCVLYEAISGKRPFRGDTLPQVARSLETDTPPPLRNLRSETPSALNDLVVQLLAKQRENRPQTCGEVVEVLRQIERSLTATSAPETPIPPRRKQRWLVLLAIAMTALGIGIGYVIGFYRGTLMIECDDPSITVRLRQGEVIHTHSTRERSLGLWPGEYDIEATEEHPHVSIRPTKISVEYGGTTHIRIERKSR